MKFFKNCMVCKALFAYLLFTANAAYTQQTAKHYLNIKSNKDLKEFFKYTPDRIPLICGHRGGAQNLFPENSIAGLDYILTKMPAFFEIDPRLTKDSVAVVLHDATLDRTTTGAGKLSDYTWDEIKKLKLKDKKGLPTEFGVHTLEEVLNWAKGKTILMIDKKDVPREMLYEIIKKTNAQDHVLISAYTPEDALFYHQKDKSLMFEAFILNKERLKAFEDTNIPWGNMVAYLSGPKEPEFYDELRRRNVMTFVYTAKNVDKIKDKGLRKKGYKEVLNRGADIILTDRAEEAFEAIQELIPKKSSKAKFFKLNK